jgi:hypothetical protein
LAIWYIFPILVCSDQEKSGNPDGGVTGSAVAARGAALVGALRGRVAGPLHRSVALRHAGPAIAGQRYDNHFRRKIGAFLESPSFDPSFAKYFEQKTKKNLL